MSQTARMLPLGLALLSLAACSDQSMERQPKARSYRPSEIWSDGTSARPLPPHTVARGDLAREAALADPPPVDMALLERGRERYEIACAPCHGLGGRGDGMIVQRGFPPPPDYNSPRLRAVPASHIVDVITNGYGVMYSYAARVEPADRWAIAAYVRALQTSASVPVSAVADAKDKLP
jgi:mono/diheme cytochrome c family protein